MSVTFVYLINTRNRSNSIGCACRSRLFLPWRYASSSFRPPSRCLFTSKKLSPLQFLYHSHSRNTLKRRTNAHSLQLNSLNPHRPSVMASRPTHIKSATHRYQNHNCQLRAEHVPQLARPTGVLPQPRLRPFLLLYQHQVLRGLNVQRPKEAEEAGHKRMRMSLTTMKKFLTTRHQRSRWILIRKRYIGKRHRDKASEVLGREEGAS